MKTERTLLADYAVNGSETAFREVVTRYIDLVFSTAVRLVYGDTHLAEDVVQMVFADLARLARTLSPDVTLGGWLHRRTCHVALSLMRSQRRRQNRERQAAEMNAQQDPPESSFSQVAPMLDEAINELAAEDRAAITLRFFERRDFRSIGEELGSTEDAAQKRVTRALEKLRGMLARRGATASVAGLATVMGVHAVTAAPAGLAASVSITALASAATSGGVTLTLLKLMAMTKLQVVVSAVVVAGLGTTLVVEHQTLTKLREQNEALQQQVEQLARQAQARSPNLVAPTDPSASLGQKQLQELNRLRGKVHALRPLTNDLAKLQVENHQLRTAADEPEDPAEAEFKKQTQEQVNNLRVWGLDFHMYARQNHGQFPESWEQAFSVSQKRSSAKDESEFGSYMNDLTNRFEIVYRSTDDGVSQPGEAILFREKQARRSPKGEWIKVYGFADGSVTTHAESDETSFEAWEKQRLAGIP